MSKIRNIQPDLVRELRKRAIDKRADVHRLIEDFEETPGSRILLSEGDGEVALLVPARDGYEGPDRLKIAAASNTANVVANIQRSRTVEVEGVGKFYEFILNPLQYKKKVGTDSSGDDRTRIAIQGEGKGGTVWSPLGFESSWFVEDLPLLSDLAIQGGMEVRPDVEEDPRDGSWKKLSKAERDVVETALRKKVGEVVHESTIEAALEKLAVEDGATSGAVKSLTLALSGVSEPPAAVSASESQAEGAQRGEAARRRSAGFTPAGNRELDAEVAEALAQARPVLEKVLGADALDPDGFPEPLIRVAEEKLASSGANAEASSLRELLKGEDVDREEIAGALDRAFGAGFTDHRTISLDLLDRVIDEHAEKLTFAEVDSLRTLREDVDYHLEHELFGGDLAQKALSTKSADAKIKEIAAHLSAGTGLDQAAIADLAYKLAAAINVPSPRPAVIVLAGEGGTAIDTVYARAKALCSKEPIEVQGAVDLRMTDPVGYLVGSPADEPGIARGVLVRGAPEAGSGTRFVAALNGLESLGKAGTKVEDQEAATRAFWSFMGQIQRDGWFKGYDPNDPAKALGARVDLKGGVVLLRTTQTPAELQNALSPEAWSQISSRVIDFGKTSAESVLAGLREAIKDHAKTAFNLKDAEVELSASATAFLKELVAGGIAPKRLQETALEQIAPKLYFAALDGNLAPKIQIELVRGLTPKEKARLRKDWIEGKATSLAGVGGSVFAIYDAGRTEIAGKSDLSAVIEARKKSAAVETSREVERLRELIAEYQLGAAGDQKKIRDLLAENRKAFDTIGAAEKRIGELNIRNELAVWEIEELQRLNKIAEDTIVKLKADIVQANKKIDSLNSTISGLKVAGEELKAAANKAIAERDQMHQALLTAENQFNATIKTMGAGAAGMNPLDVYDSIIQTSHASGGGRYLGTLQRQMLLIATERALQQAMGHARSFNKFNEIGQLAGRYVQACNALGTPPDARVLRGFEQAARLSGNGWSRTLAQDWANRVGVPSGYEGQDPGFVDNVMRNLLRRVGVRV